MAIPTADLLHLGMVDETDRETGLKTRWLLWLEDTSNGRVSPCSSSASKPIAMLIK
jgi:hypothetical protein